MRTQSFWRSLSATTVAAIAPAFVGRTGELDQVERLLRGSRLLTVMGAPGAGKTRLAFEAAARLTQHFSGGVYVCELAPVATPPLVRAAIATALGFPPELSGDLGVQIRHKFGDAPTLIILDNCEHVRAEVAKAITSILSATSKFRVLATSRERLRTAGETAWTLPSLSLEEALQLLALRVAAVDATFEVTAGNRSALVEVCDRLERLPLALELVAARLALLPAHEVAQMLNGALDLLSDGENSDRHRTMAAALDWSVALLPTTSVVDLWRISVFPATFTLEAAAIVLEASSAETLNRLAVLRDASLLVADTSGVLAKFRLLEPIRQYALAHLAGGPIEDDVRRLHAVHVVGRAEWIGTRLLGTREQATALEAFVDLLPDLRQAVDWCQYAQPTWLAPIMGHTGWAWEITSRVREGEALERRALELTRDPADRARLLVRLAGLTQRRDHGEAAYVANQAIAEARKADCYQELGFALCFSGSYDTSDSGEVKFDEATAIANETRDVLVPAFVSTLRGGRYAATGKIEAGRIDHENAVALSRAMGDIWLTTQTATNLISAYLQLDDLGNARSYLCSTLRVLIEHPDWLASLYVLNESAILASRSGRAPDALRLVGACRRLCDEIGLPFSRLAEVEPTARKAIAGHLKPAKYLTEGGRLALLDALKLALDVAETPSQFVSRRTARRDPVTGLTQREGEVVQLIAGGLSNREIASKLFITERSAEGHVERIRNKLDVRSRSQIAVWAEQHGLRPKQPI